MKKQGGKVLGATVARWKERGFIGAVLAYPLLLFIVFYIVVNFNSFLLAFQRVLSTIIMFSTKWKILNRSFPTWFPKTTGRSLLPSSTPF